LHAIATQPVNSGGSFHTYDLINIRPPANEPELRLRPNEKSEMNLAAIPFKIIYETYRETDGRENWEL